MLRLLRPLALAVALSLGAVAHAAPTATATPTKAATATAAKPPKPEPSDIDAIRAAAPVLKKVPKVAWTRNQSVIGDVTYHRHKDVVALGNDNDVAVLAVVPGPVTATTQPILMRFPLSTRPDEKPALNMVCGVTADLRVSLEPPGVKPSDLSCAEAAMNARCHHILETEMKLQKAQHDGGKGIVISGGPCLPLHLYFADGKFQAWRND